MNELVYVTFLRVFVLKHMTVCDDTGDRGAWRLRPWGRTESDMSEGLTLLLSVTDVGELIWKYC